MPEYVIEIPHSPEECPPPGDGAAPWTTYHGCRSGTHTSWTIAELADGEEAWALVPELLRDTARVVLVERSEPPPATHTHMRSRDADDGRVAEMSRKGRHGSVHLQPTEGGNREEEA